MGDTLFRDSYCKLCYHFHWLQSVHESAKVVHNFPRVVVGNRCGVASPNAITAIDQDHGYDGAVPLWLYPVYDREGEVEGKVTKFPK